MSFVQMLLLEGLLIIIAGVILFSGIWGAVGSAGILSLLNLSANESVEFWRWEIPLLAGTAVWVIVLVVISRKARESNLITSVLGGVASLVVFGAFITPVLAIIIWALVVGVGLIPRFKRVQVFWGIAPVLWRFILGVGFIIYGNVLTL
ncbi:MAG: hypothetical protein M0T74_18420 [Desulfitobacterium hafniense]|nr:hypothetical protein [Desulfitobacterium hafniense]